MIGVLCHESEARVVQEFFELFKTPWEFHAAGRFYDFLIVTTPEAPAELDAGTIAVYSSGQTQWDAEPGSITASNPAGLDLEWGEAKIPIYGRVRTSQASEDALLRVAGTSRLAGRFAFRAGRPVVRIGYDLFQEVAFLLLQGQPAARAEIPTLELHIELLRKCVLRAGVRVVEIPPVPAGYDYMACLTHDVDFVGIRQHNFDHTMWGFLYRALAGSARDALRGRLSWKKMARNWKAAFSLPLVQLGVLPDFWLEFDRYMQIEKGLGSTFFFIPFKGVAGEQADGPAPKRRAAKYEFAEMKQEVCGLAEQGAEIGLHGVDAWKSAEKGREELRRIRELAGPSAVGARMHWLYFGEDSPKALEEAGFAYDSTFGYNDAVGFRAGTAQAYCPPAAQTLLELPLTIQDTALFYPSRMNLSSSAAMKSCTNVLQTAARFGGTVTVNWHTRSLSPERLWDEFYTGLLSQFRKHQVWFGTGAEIVRWYGRRRALRFDSVRMDAQGMHLKLTGAKLNGQPFFVLRVHEPKAHSDSVFPDPSPQPAFRDTQWKGDAEQRVAF